MLNLATIVLDWQGRGLQMAVTDGARTVGSLKIIQAKRSRRKLYALAGTVTLLILCVSGYLFLRPVPKLSDCVQFWSAFPNSPSSM